MNRQQPSNVAGTYSGDTSRFLSRVKSPTKRPNPGEAPQMAHNMARNVKSSAVGGDGVEHCAWASTPNRQISMAATTEARMYSSQETFLPSRFSPRKESRKMLKS